jgi:hypothetical protein
MKGRRTDMAGFALVDLLVAMAVAGLAGSILVGLVAFVERSNAATARRAQEHDGALAVERVLRIVMENADPFVPGTPVLAAIAGDDKEMVILSNGLPILGLPQAAAFRLRREEQVSGSPVTLSWADGEGRSRTEVLARHVSEFAVAYLPRRIQGPGDDAWRRRWSAQEGPLGAVRIRLRFVSASMARTFVIPVRADLPASCLRDARRAGCAVTGGA